VLISNLQLLPTVKSRFVSEFIFHRLQKIIQLWRSTWNHAARRPAMLEDLKLTKLAI